MALLFTKLFWTLVFEFQTIRDYGVHSLYCMCLHNTEAWLGTNSDMLLFCDRLTKLLNRISADRTALNYILISCVMLIFKRGEAVCVCSCACVRVISSEVSQVEYFHYMI
jgi:hypothetical protein